MGLQCALHLGTMWSQSGYHVGYILAPFRLMMGTMWAQSVPHMGTHVSVSFPIRDQCGAHLRCPYGAKVGEPTWGPYVYRHGAHIGLLAG